MWNAKTKVTLVITGATGSISKSLRQYLRKMSGKDETKEPQKTAILGNATHTAESANVEAHICSTQNNITCSTDCEYRTAAAVYTVGTGVFQVYTCKCPA
jgi:hypothetical protein